MENIKDFSEIGYRVELTQDGSPSLRLLQGPTSEAPSDFLSASGTVAPSPARGREGESMHHSGGAYSETDLIYGTPLRQILARGQGGQFLVVGLGLGYIEMVIARECLQRGLMPDQVRIVSFESVQGLTDLFLCWIHQGEIESRSETEFKALSSPLTPGAIHQTAALSCIQGTGISVGEIRSYLRQLTESGHLQILGALGPNLAEIERTFPEWGVSKKSFDGLFYDAFSVKTTPHLWDEDYLVGFLELLAAPGAIFSTYACRGALKRALVRAGFEVYVRDGFKGKRNSTFGIHKQKT